MALVGSSGCGKSTCVQLMQRFYDVGSGSVKIDARNVTELNLGWLRSQIGVVSQEPVLFGQSIKENILYGREEAGEDEVVKAAKNANGKLFNLLYGPILCGLILWITGSFLIFG